MDSQRFIKTYMLSHWAYDIERLMKWANSNIGKKLDFYDRLYLTEIVHFQIIVPPEREGEGYYIAVLYKVEFVA